MSVDADINEMRVTGRNGAYDLLGDGFQVGNQSYAAEFLVVNDCDDPQNKLIDQLRGAIQATGDLIGEFDTGRRRAKARLVSVKSEPNFNDIRAGIHRVICEFRAAPFWDSDSLILIEPDASTTMIALNSGNAVSRAIKFTLTPAANISSLTLTSGDVSLVYDAALTTSDTLVIDVEAGTVKKNGTNVYGSVTLPDTQAALFEFAIGYNTITASSAVTGRVEYRSCWV